MKISGISFASLKTKPKILIGICSPLILLMGLGATSIFSIDTIVETNEWVDHTRVVLGDSAAIVGSAVDMETGMRGYLLAGEDGFLDPYRSGEEATYSGLAALRETVSDNPAQVARLNQVEATLREWQANVTEPTIALRREIGDAKTMNDMAALVGEARGKVYFDGFRGQIATFVEREATLLAQRRTDFQTAQTAVGEDFGLVQQTMGWVDHTHEVLAAAAGIVSAAVDMETGMRGYLLAGQEDFLAPYEGGKVAFFDGMQALQKTVDDNPAQVARLQEAEQTIREWMAQVTEPTIGLRAEIGDAETMNDMAALVGEARGKVYFDRFRGQIAAFIGREAALLNKRRGEFQTAQGAVGDNFGLVQDTTGWVDHTHEVLAAAARLLASAVDMETGMRGYLLAGEEGFLDPYNTGKTAFFEGMGALQKSVDDNPEQVARLQESEATIREWVDKVTEPAIALRQQVNAGERPIQAIQTLVSRKTGKKYFDAFRGQIEAFSEVERTLMAERQATATGAGTKVSADLAVMNQNEEGVAHTYEVIGHANDVLAAAVDMETGMRGYLLAGQEDFLAPYTDGAKRFYELLASLSETVNDNPAQVKLLGEVEQTIRAWQSEVTEPTIALRREIGDAKNMDDMADLIGEARGKQYFDAFRAIMAEFATAESGLMAERQETASGAEKSVASNLGVMNQNEEWVTHTYEVIEHANAILAAAVDMETGMRGYLLAGQEEFLAPYTGGAEQFYALIASLSETVNDNPAQVKLLAEAEQTIGEWQENVTEPTIALRREIGNAKTMDDMADLVGEARGKVYFDKFRALMADFNAEETGLMEQRQSTNQSTVSNTFVIIGICVAVAIVIGLLLAWLIGNGIANPIRKMTEAMKLLAGGEKGVDIPGTDRSDEVGEMAEAVQVFKDNAIATDATAAAQAKEQTIKEEQAKAIMELCSEFDTTASTALESVASAASDMQVTAESMSATAEETNVQASQVAAASEEAATNVQTVAGAAEEMSASIIEIGRQVAQSGQIAERAVAEAEETNSTVQGLAEAAEKIGAVVELITSIAEQTNLLALNATIEAARAGDAGKGFAVVASEVKSLAKQTNEATDEISQQIGSMQSVAGEAVTAIANIGTTITEVNEIAATISATVKEQASATEEISRNVQEAASGTQEVSSNISGVSEGAQQTGKAASQVLETAGMMSQESSNLRESVNKFLDNIKTA